MKTLKKMALEDAVWVLGHDHPETHDEGWGKCDCELAKALRALSIAPKQNHVLKELGIELTGRLKSGIGCDPDDLQRYLDAIEAVVI